MYVRTATAHRPSGVTTFNSCLGLTLMKAGFDLTHEVFLHGQLYTVLSRIRGRAFDLVMLDGINTKKRVMGLAIKE
jgi:hypothetical protein